MRRAARQGAGAAGVAPALRRFRGRRSRALATLGSLLAACAPPEPTARPLEVFQGASMGTTYTVKVVGAMSPEERGAASRAITAELEAVDAAMSTYLEDSELSRLNRHPVGEPFPLSAASAEVFALALELSELTGGAFDITVGPLVDAWGFGPGEAPAAPPDLEEIARLRERTGTALLRLSSREEGGTSSEEDATASLEKLGEVSCDLSAIAKGYAVDRVAGALDHLGWRDHMVEVGGEVRARGGNAEGRVWRIGIERPQALRGAVLRIVPLAEMAMATSGDYRNVREVGEGWVSHILDPRTGYPVPHTLASVTVLDESAARADALATALMVLGPEEGHALAEREGVAALFLLREGERFIEKSTHAFDRLAAGESQAAL